MILVNKDKETSKEIEIVKDPEKLRPILNKISWEILKVLSRKESYPAEIAEELGAGEQKVYYHIRKLANSGLVKVKRKEAKKGALAKYYRPKSPAFGVELPFGARKLRSTKFGEKDEKVLDFFYPIIKGGKMNGNIVVGSPDPHGPNRVRGRDGHYSAHLSLFLGKYADLDDGFLPKLDVDIKAEKELGNNLISIGGVLTNLVTSEFNEYLPIKFNTTDFPFREIISEKTGETYRDETCGIISKIVNPFNKEKSVIVIAGIRYIGTKACVLALANHPDKVLKNYEGEDNWGTVIKGYDSEGNGKIDSIEIEE